MFSILNIIKLKSLQPEYTHIFAMNFRIQKYRAQFAHSSAISRVRLSQQNDAKSKINLLIKSNVYRSNNSGCFFGERQTSKMRGTFFRYIKIKKKKTLRYEGYSKIKNIDKIRVRYIKKNRGASEKTRV